MEPAESSLADLMELSSQIEAAVLFDATGAVAAASIAEDAAARLARLALDLLEAARSVRPGAGGPVRVQAAYAEGSLFVAREGERAIAATTTADAVPALVAYDLKTCLRRSAPEQPKPRRRRSAKKEPNASP